MTTSQDYLVAIGLAAKESGIRKIQYPVFQAFAYYLRTQKRVFTDYLFNGAALPPPRDQQEPIEFPQSVELAEDLNLLVSYGFYREVAGSVAYEITSRAEARRERYIGRWESGAQQAFSELRELAAQQLSLPEELLRRSYQQYIRELG